MNQKRIQNILLAVVAVLLLANLGVTLFPGAQAIPKTQYIAITSADRMSGITQSSVQQVLDQQSAQGWVYVGTVGSHLIFKK